MALVSEPSAHGDKTLVRAETVDDGVLRLTLDNPPANCLSMATLDALTEALTAAEADSDVRVIIVSAAGKIFSAGHDIRELTNAREEEDRGRAFFQSAMAKCSAVMQTIVSHPRPIIAEVDGLATAAGCQLVASCDLAFASESAAFQTPGVNIGLFCSTPMVALSRCIGRKHAMEMLLTGEPIDADRALEIGLVNQVLAETELTGTVVQTARLIASKSSQTVKIGKAAFYRQAEKPLAEAYSYAAQVMTENLLAADAREGMGAFLEKRDPKWQGR